MTCLYDLFILLVYITCLYYLFILLVYITCLYYLFILLVYVYDGWSYYKGPSAKEEIAPSL